MASYRRIKEIFNGSTTFPVTDKQGPIHRQNSYPLDTTEVFESLEKAQQYAQDEIESTIQDAGLAYVGQKITVVNEDEKTADTYMISDDDGTLVKFAVKDSNGKIPVNDLPVVSENESGILTSQDKSKLNGIENGANKYVHPTHTSKLLGLYKVAVDTSGHVNNSETVTKSDITALGIPAQDTTYNAATSSNLGLVKIGSNITNNVGEISLTSKNITDALGYTPGSGGGNVTGPTESTIDHVVTFTNATGNKIKDSGFTIGASVPANAKFTDTTYNAATTTSDGLMSSTDKSKLDGIAAGANKYTHPTYTSKTSGLYKVTVDGTGHVNSTSSVTKSDITALGIPAQDTTYSAATDSNLGLVKVGSNISNSSGEISLTGKNVTDALGYIPGSGGGNVTGPGSSSVDNIVTFSDKTGTKIADSGFTIKTSVPENAKFTDTTYTASNGITLTGNNFTNSGVRSVTSGSENGTISVNTNGTTTNVSVKGLTSNAFSTTTFAPLNSPKLTGTPTTTEPATDSNNTQIATTSFVQTTVASKIAANDAMVFKGTLGTEGTITSLPTNAKCGWTYKVITAGSYSGYVCEVGDMIICTKTSTTAPEWTVAQGNIDGAVTGPSSSTANRIATFSNTTGKVIKDSGFTIATSVPANAKFTDTTYSAATTSAAGLMSAADKSKLDGIAANANNYTHPSYTSKTSGLYKVTVDGTGHVSSATSVTKSDITALGIPAQDTTYSAATTSAAGLMSATDKSKLDGIATGANKITVDSAMSSTSTNPVQNKIVNSAISAKLPLAGGTMTGPIISTVDNIINRSVNTGYLAITGGSVNMSKAGGGNGARLYLYGGETTVEDSKGTFSLSANDGTTEKALIGRTTGLLSWDGKSIVRSVNSKTADTAGNVVSQTYLKVGTSESKADGATTNGNTYLQIVEDGNLRSNKLIKGTGAATVTSDTNGVITINSTNTTYSTATTSTTGLMSATDKSKLDGIATGATKITVDSALSSSSTNPVQNKIVNSAVSARLPLAGGTMTGSIKTNTVPSLTYASETAVVQVGTWNSGAAINIKGPSYSTNPGAIEFIAQSSTESSSGIAYPSGKFTWNGSNIVRSVNGNTANDSGAVTIPNFKASGTTAASGLVPAPSTTAGTTKYLREDGTWQVPPNTTYSAASTTAAGLMSAADKTKLNGIATGANAYTHPTYTAKSSGFYKVTVDGTGHVSATTAVAKSDITALGIPAQDTTYSNATSYYSGLMSSTDKSKLDGIAAGANAYTLPNATTTTLGGVIVGTGLSVSDGVLSVSGSSIPVVGSILSNGSVTSASQTLYKGSTTTPYWASVNLWINGATSSYLYIKVNGQNVAKYVRNYDGNEPLAWSGPALGTFSLSSSGVSSIKGFWSACSYG